MEYLLHIVFGASIALLPYQKLSECQKDAEYYQIHYGEEVTDVKCIPYSEIKNLDELFN